MKKRDAIGLLLTGFSVSAFRAAEAAQSLGEKSGALSAFQQAHPLLTILTHIGAILLLVGFFALLFAGSNRESNKF
jgi:hypothetical protein